MYLYVYMNIQLAVHSMMTCFLYVKVLGVFLLAEMYVFIHLHFYKC